MCRLKLPHVLRGRIRQEGGVRVVLAAMREHRLQLQLQQKACELMYELMYRLHTDLEESFDLWKPVVEEVVAVVLVSMQKHPTDLEMLDLGSCVIGHYWRHWTLNIAGDGSNVHVCRTYRSIGWPIGLGSSGSCSGGLLGFFMQLAKHPTQRLARLVPFALARSCRRCFSFVSSAANGRNPISRARRANGNASNAPRSCWLGLVVRTC